MNAFIRAALAAFFNAMREKAMDKIKEKAKELAEKFGIRIDNWTDDQLAKLAAAKDQLDAETRRKTRAFWAPIGFVLGALVGYVVAVVL